MIGRTAGVATCSCNRSPDHSREVCEIRLPDTLNANTALTSITCEYAFIYYLFIATGLQHYIICGLDVVCMKEETRGDLDLFDSMNGRGIEKVGWKLEIYSSGV